MSKTDDKIKAYAPNELRSWWLVWNPATRDWLTHDYLRGALMQIPGVGEDYETIVICGPNLLADDYSVGVEVPMSLFWSD
jgi:hypothetical protein